MYEKLSGLTYIKFLNDLSTNQQIEEISRNLTSLSEFILIANDLRVIITTDESMDKTTQKIVEMSTILPSRTFELEKDQKSFEPSFPQNYVKFDIQVNFCSQSMLTVPFNHPDYPYMLILASIIMWKHLHPEIREKGSNSNFNSSGGAYGASSTQSKFGVYSMTTYRDPNSIGSLKTFNTSIESICQGNFDENDIYEAKLYAFQSMDSPIVPRKKIDDFFFFGITDEVKQNLRDTIFKADKIQLKKVCEKHLLNKSISQSIIGPKNNVQQEIEENWTMV
jgi:presequence protease